MRRTLVLALAAALLPSAAAHAEDLLQTYQLARTGDPQLAAAESGRLATKEGAVQARALLLPQINGQATLTRTKGDNTGSQVFGGTPLPPSDSTNTSTNRQLGVGLQQAVLDFGRFSALHSQAALGRARDFQLRSAGAGLGTRHWPA